MEEINMSNGSSLRARGAATEVINLAAGTGAVAARTGAAGLLQSQVRSQSPQFQTEDPFDDKDDGSGGGDDDDGDADADDDPEVNYRDPPEGYLRLRPSQFNHIPATVFVEYPPELGLTRKDLSSLEKLGRRKLHYICYWGRNCVKNAFRRAGFIDNSSNWTATWAKHQPPEVLNSLNCLQKVNHFPGSWCIGRKDRLMRTIQGMKRIHGEAVYGFHPEGYVLPGDSDQLERAIQSMSSSKKQLPLWIMKPVASSCGRGIKVITTDKALSIAKTKKKVLIQRYLANPYLINGKKFDLRIYVLVTGTDPLRIYIHQEGLTRISTDDYSLKNTKNKFAHLTNYSVNKKAPHFMTASEDNLKAVNYRTNCSELFGFDIFLDQSLTPHLIEVNISPSLMGSSPLDRRIKGTLLADYCHVTGFYPHDPQLLARYSSGTGTSTSSSAGVGASVGSGGVGKTNPFSLLSLSKDMGQQEKWRREPTMQNIDMAALVGDSCWMMLCMCEDEFQRAQSSFFRLIHPPPPSTSSSSALERNLLLYKQHRFSDHLLARYVSDGMSKGKRNLRYLPPRFLAQKTSPTAETTETTGERSGRPPRPNPSRQSSSSSPSPSSSRSPSLSSDRKGRRSHSSGPKARAGTESGRSTSRERFAPRAAGVRANIEGRNTRTETSERGARPVVKPSLSMSQQEQHLQQQQQQQQQQRRCSSASVPKRGLMSPSSTVTAVADPSPTSAAAVRSEEAQRSYEDRRERYPLVRASSSSRGNNNGNSGRPNSRPTSASSAAASAASVGRGEAHPSIDQKYLPIGALRNKAQYSQYARHLHPPPPETITIALASPRQLQQTQQGRQGDQGYRRPPSPSSVSSRASATAIASASQSSRPAGFRVLTYGSIGLPTAAPSFASASVSAVSTDSSSMIPVPVPPERGLLSSTGSPCPLSPRVLQQKEQQQQSVMGSREGKTVTPAPAPLSPSTPKPRDIFERYE